MTSADNRNDSTAWLVAVFFLVAIAAMLVGGLVDRAYNVGAETPDADERLEQFR